MGGGNSGRKKKAPEKKSSTLTTVEGSGPNKRTKRHVGDPHAGADMYIMDDILAMRFANGERQYLVRW